MSLISLEIKDHDKDKIHIKTELLHGGKKVRVIDQKKKNFKKI